MRLLITGFVLLLSGCAIVPENIKIADEEQLVSYEQVVASSSSTITKPARWGGLIAEVENLQEGSFVEVVAFPLNHYGKPNIANESAGRFKVKMEDFLDPVVFESGRVITFTGTVSESTEGVIGEQAYVYPTLVGNSFHLWRKETVYDVSNLNVGFFPGGFHGGFYGRGLYGGPFFRGGRFGLGFRNGGFNRSRVRVVERAPKASPSRVRANTSAFKGRRSSQSDRVQ